MKKFWGCAIIILIIILAAISISYSSPNLSPKSTSSQISTGPSCGSRSITISTPGEEETTINPCTQYPDYSDLSLITAESLARERALSSCQAALAEQNCPAGCTGQARITDPCEVTECSWVQSPIKGALGCTLRVTCNAQGTIELSCSKTETSEL